MHQLTVVAQELVILELHFKEWVGVRGLEVYITQTSQFKLTKSVSDVMYGEQI